MATPQQPRRRPQQTHAQPYHWFQGASVRALYDQIGNANPDTARLEVRVDGEQMRFRVVSTGGGEERWADTASADINDSRRCPPVCP
jgi:hypothetical protein